MNGVYGVLGVSSRVLGRVRFGVGEEPNLKHLPNPGELKRGYDSLMRWGFFTGIAIDAVEAGREYIPAISFGELFLALGDHIRMKHKMPPQGFDNRDLMEKTIHGINDFTEPFMASERCATLAKRLQPSSWPVHESEMRRQLWSRGIIGFQDEGLVRVSHGGFGNIQLTPLGVYTYIMLLYARDNGGDSSGPGPGPRGPNTPPPKPVPGSGGGDYLAELMAMSREHVARNGQPRIDAEGGIQNSVSPARPRRHSGRRRRLVKH